MKIARDFKRQGYDQAVECYAALWPVVVQNMAVEAELTDEQTQKLVRMNKEIHNVVANGPRELEMNPEEYAEYICAKADEIRGKLMNVWGG